MITILINKDSNRLRYVLDLIFDQVLGVDYELVIYSDEESVGDNACLCYMDKPKGKGVHIRPHTLLYEKDIKEQEIHVEQWEDLPIFFTSFDKTTSIPFDLFAAAFYLCSRYEEYLPHVTDEHGRFDPTQSLAFEEKFLELPLINLWVGKLEQVLLDHFPELEFKKPGFKFISTIDVDSAWEYKHKGIIRNAGGFAKSLIKLNLDLVKTRWKVLRDKEHDSFDTYDYIKNIHGKHKLKPLFFILFSDYGDYDKNIGIHNTSFQSLLKELGDYAEIGIHPSYQSNSQAEKIKSELENLQDVIKRDVLKSRQHYIRMRLPDTYRALLMAGVKEDYSMGYASLPGFRSSCCTPHYFFDLEMNKSTELLIYPLAVMEGTLKDYLDLNPKESIEIILKLLEVVRSVGGTFIPIWHNESLSNKQRWEGWREVFEMMINAGSE